MNPRPPEYDAGVITIYRNFVIVTILVGSHGGEYEYYSLFGYTAV
jgi:hypothetical protein